MTVDDLRQRNRQKAEEEAGRAPVRSTSDAAPIGEAIEAFHTRTDVDRLVAGLAALAALVDAHAARDGGPHRGHVPDVPDPAALRMPTVMLPREAFLGRTEMVPWRQAAGRVAAEMTCPYPPGIPVVAPGERLTGEVVDYLQQLAAAGVVVEGAVDEPLAEFRVVA